MSSTQREIEQGFAFLATLKKEGPVYAALKPVIENLQAQYGNAAVVEPVATSTERNEQGKLEIQTMIVAIHKILVEEGFICVVEKPSSVAGILMILSLIVCLTKR